MFSHQRARSTVVYAAPSVALIKQRGRNFVMMLILASLLVCFGSAWAATDPTLPNPAWLAIQPNTQPNISPVVPDKPAGVSLVLTGESRKFAIVDGQIVRIHEVHNGSRVLNIKSSMVVMQDRSKSLKLAPGVGKKMLRSAPLKKSKSVQRKGSPLLNGDRGMQ